METPKRKCFAPCVLWFYILQKKKMQVAKGLKRRKEKNFGTQKKQENQGKTKNEQTLSLDRALD